MANDSIVIIGIGGKHFVDLISLPASVFAADLFLFVVLNNVMFGTCIHSIHKLANLNKTCGEIAIAVAMAVHATSIAVNVSMFA